MADQSFELDVLRDLVEESRLVGQLGKNEKSFAAAYEAFRSGDRKGFQAVLKRLGLLARCHLVCEWIRVKECIFVCLHLCGPPKPVTRAPDPRALAEAIVRITSDEKALRQLVQAIEKPDPAAWQRLVKQYKLGPYCHFFCHWVCYVRYQLVCRWVCDPLIVERPDLATELQAAGNAMRALLERKQVFDQLAKASLDGDNEKLAGIVQEAELQIFCRWICFFWCSWRCVLVCLTICREFPLPVIDNPLVEARAFAQEVGKLGADDLEALSAAVAAGDAKAFSAHVERLKLQRYCIQLCHWLCFVRCRRFCFLWCPPIYNHPWFTHVGDFNIDADIDPATGLTNKAPIGHGGVPHGGPDYGFFGNLILRGFCPKTHPTTGEPMAYRFRYDKGGGGPKPVTGVGVVSDVRVGYRYILWLGFLRKQDLWVSASPPAPPPPGLFPPPHYLVPDAQGWVHVDPDAQDDGFDGDLMGFRSDVVFAGGDATPAGLTAGDPVSGVQQKNGIDTAIHFQATRVSTINAVNSGAAPPDFHNDLTKIHINNWSEVSLLELQEFINPGSTPCTPLTNDLHVLYTTDHELMAEWSIDMVTAANVVPAPAFPFGAGPRGGNGSDFHDISTWPNCSYLIRLWTRRSLTDGLDDDGPKWIFRTFCVGRRGN